MCVRIPVNRKEKEMESPFTPETLSRKVPRGILGRERIEVVLRDSAMRSLQSENADLRGLIERLLIALLHTEGGASVAVSIDLGGH